MSKDSSELCTECVSKFKSFRKSGRSHDGQEERQRSSTTSRFYREERGNYDANPDSDSDDDSFTRRRAQSLNIGPTGGHMGSYKSTSATSMDTHDLHDVRTKKRSSATGGATGGSSVAPLKGLKPGRVERGVPLVRQTLMVFVGFR